MYRQPVPPSTPPQVGQDVLDYEQQLIRRARRKKIIGGAVITLLLTIGLGGCFGPIGCELAKDAWHSRKTKLTPEEQKRVAALLDPIEANAKKSQAAFDAVWPRIRGNAIGARHDLGPCRVNVPGPSLKTKDESRSLADSSQAYGWTFVDLTPADRRSPIETLKMPAGSIALGNYPGSDRFVLPDRPLRTAPPDRAPMLSSTAMGPKAAELRAESAKGIRADSHADYMRRVTAFAEDGLGIDVVVFLDMWIDPHMTSEVKQPELPKDDYETFAKPTPKASRIFDTGYAFAHAIAWSPEKQEIACASQALAMNSAHVTFRSNNLTPLQQDLVLELERALDRSFVAAGEGPPPPLDRPPVPAAAEDAGAPDAGPVKKPKKRR